jgi:transcriptional regulator with XRE-family HTH domain
MTAGELMRSARTRAGLSQAEVATRTGSPRSQIARWEADQVDPGFSAVRKVLRACGFDLSMALQIYAPDQQQEERLLTLARLTPKERLDQALVRGGATRSDYDLDPYAILGELEGRGIDYILIGSLARVLQGADEVPAGLDLTFPKNALQATDEALQGFARRAPGSLARSGDAWLYRCATGTIKIIERPAGTQGFTDLRRRAEWVHLGRGLRPRVAAPGDLVRMMEALGRAGQEERLEEMRRLMEAGERPGV